MDKHSVNIDLEGNIDTPLVVNKSFKESELTSQSQSIPETETERETEGQASDQSDQEIVKWCYCGNPDGHQWAPTSQCVPPSPTTSVSLFSDILHPNQSDDDSRSTTGSISSTSSWGISRLPPSLVEEVNDTDDKARKCDGNCPTATRLREEIQLLKEEITHLNIALNKVPGYPEYFNITYEGDTSVYVYRLLEDYRIGDLRVLVQ